MAERVYDGFISYSHAADGLLAPRLQQALQRFAKPWWKRRALRVFRDESSLSANPHLWSSITEALDTSEWFVLLLSPDAAASPWVNQEIEYWKMHRDPSRILPVLTDGTFAWDGSNVVGNAAPQQLEGAFSEEPRWVDLRFAKDEENLDLKHPRFADATADVASTLRGLAKDELASEEVKQHRRTVRTAWAAVVLLVGLGVAAGVAAVQATRSANEARGRALLAAASDVSRSDLDLALLLTLQAAEHLGDGGGSVESALHNIFMVGTEVTPLDVLAEAHAKSFAVAQRPGTNQVAVSAAGNQIDLFDIDTGGLLSTFGSSNDDFSPSVPGISFDREGSRLAAIDTSGRVRVWNVETGEQELEIDTEEGATGRVLFGPDGSTLITSIHTRTVWNIDSQTVIWTNTEKADGIGGVDISYDHEGRWLAWSARDRSVVEVVELATGEPVWTIPLPGAIAVDFHPTADVLAVKSQGSGTRMYDLASGEPTLVARIEGVAPTAILFDEDGDRFAVGNDSGVEIHQAVDPRDPGAGWRQTGFLPTGASFGFSYAFLSEHSLAIGHKVGAGMYALEKPGELQSISLDSPLWTLEAVPGTPYVYTSHTPNMGRNALYLHDLSAGSSKLISDGDIEAPGFVVTRSVTSDAVAAYLPAEDMVAVLDPSTGTVITELEHPVDAAPWAIDISQDGSLVVAAMKDTSEIVVWDVESGGTITDRFSLDGIIAVRSVRLNPAADLLAVGGDGGLMLVELDDLAAPERLPAEGSLLSLQFSPDGKWLATGDDTFGFLYVYDVESRERIQRISLPGAFDPEFSPDGTQLILGAAQSGVVAFDTGTWERRWTIPRDNLGGAVLASVDVVGDQVVFSPIPGPIQVLTLDFDELLVIARERLNRGFTQEECVQYLIDPCPSPNLGSDE